MYGGGFVLGWRVVGIEVMVGEWLPGDWLVVGPWLVFVVGRFAQHDDCDMCREDLINK